MEDLEENVVALRDALNELHARGAELEHLCKHALSVLVPLQAERRTLAKHDVQFLAGLRREIAAATLEGERKRMAAAHVKAVPAVRRKPQAPGPRRPPTPSWWKVYWRETSKRSCIALQRVMVMTRKKSK